MRKSHISRVLSVFILYSATSSVALAVEYTITKIADTSSGLSTIYSPVINASGSVLFSAEQPGGGQVLQSYSGGLLTTIADTSGGYDYFNGYGLNDSGSVAYGAGLDAGGEAMYTVIGGTTSEILNTTGLFDGLGVNAINNNDVVLFDASYDEPADTGAVVSGFHTIDGSAVTTIVDNSGSLNGLFGASMNNNNLVAFSTFDSSGARALYTGNGGALVKVADDSGIFSGFDDTSINDSGIVSFTATLDAGGGGVYTDNAGTLTTIADTGGSFSAFRSTSINNNGDVVFKALSGIGEGLYTGADPSSDLVIERGAVIDGEMLVFFAISEFAINNSGQIAFQADFANESGQGIYIATPTAVPLPASVWFFITGLMVLTGMSRRKAA